MKLFQNKQEFLDHLLKVSKEGGFPSIQIVTTPDKIRCAYRGDNGCKCPVGHLISDELYNDYFEGMGPQKIINLIGEEWIPNGLTLEDLINIQIYHDVQTATRSQKWDHGKFVVNLKNLLVFEGCDFSKA